MSPEFQESNPAECIMRSQQDTVNFITTLKPDNQTEILKLYKEWISKKQIGHFKTEARQKFPQLFTEQENWKISMTPQILSQHISNSEGIADTRIQMTDGTSRAHLEANTASMIVPENFLPKGTFSNIHIPTYCYISKEIPDMLKCKVTPRSPQYYHLWSLLYRARYKARTILDSEHQKTTIWPNKDNIFIHMMQDSKYNMFTFHYDSIDT